MGHRVRAHLHAGFRERFHIVAVEQPAVVYSYLPVLRAEQPGRDVEGSANAEACEQRRHVGERRTEPVVEGEDDGAAGRSSAQLFGRLELVAAALEISDLRLEMLRRDEQPRVVGATEPVVDEDRPRSEEASDHLSAAAMWRPTRRAARAGARRMSGS